MSNRFLLHEVSVDTQAIEANTRALIRDVEAAAIVADAIVADVRADGYGHGAVASALAALAGGATWLGVSSPADRRELREAGVTAPIISLAGEASHTGWESAPGASHQYAHFLPGPELYGLVAAAEIRPAMRVSGRVVGVKEIAEGEGVSYGYTYRAERATRLALVALGYANGLDRYASNTGSLWLGGKPRMIAGRVAMNVVVIDLGGDHAAVGDEAIAFGDPANAEPPIWTWASALGKSPAEVASICGTHLPRRYR